MLEQEEGRWLTYAEAGQLLGISPEAVRQLARRRSWPRRTPNAYGVHATVLVPAEAIVRPQPAVDPVHTPYERGTTNRPLSRVERADGNSVRPYEVADAILTIRDMVEDFVASLRDQLDRERTRSDRAERRVDELETALIKAEVALADAQAAGLRAELQLRARAPWWRWWFR